MRLAGLGKLFAMMYDDRMDIYRTAKSNNDDDTTDISYNPEPLYQDIPCRLSFSSDDTGSDSEVDRNPVAFSSKLFCAADVDIKAGDYVTVRRLSDEGVVMRTYKGQVAMPTWYATHQEVFVRVDEGA